MMLSIYFLFVKLHIKNSLFFLLTNWDLVAVQRLLELHVTICFIVHICYSVFVLEKQTSKKADYHASLISLSDVLPSGKSSYFLKRQIESTRKAFVLYI